MHIIHNKKTKVVFLIIMLIEILYVLLVAAGKSEYHIDEMYSYILSNSYKADRISSDDNMWERWVNPEELMDFITVQEGQRFSFKKVYLNNSKDCHPPLYYWLLHIVCSLVPDTFSKWTGIFINIIFYTVTLVFLSKISMLLIDDRWLVYLSVILYGMSPIAIETVTFLRMYMLLTMFATMLIYVLLLIFKDGIDKRKLIYTGVIIYLGSMTQHYFVILSFWMVIIYGILNIKKAPRKVLTYGVVCLLSVLAYIISYPYVISQVLGSQTNNVSSELKKDMFNIKAWVKYTFILVRTEVKSLSYIKTGSVILAATVLFAVVYLLWIFRNKEKRVDAFEDLSVGVFLLWLVITYICIFLTITFISGRHSYLRYVYYIGPAQYVIFTYILFLIYKQHRKIAMGIILAIVLYSAGSSIYGGLARRSEYLYIDSYRDDCMLKNYAENSLVVFTDRNPAVPTGNLMKFNIFDRFYMDDKQDILEADILGKCLNDDKECIVYINTDTYFTNGYDAEETVDAIRRSLGNRQIKVVYLCDGCLGEFYRIYE